MVLVCVWQHGGQDDGGKKEQMEVQEEAEDTGMLGREWQQLQWLPISLLPAWAVGRPAAGSGLSGSQGQSPLTAVGLDSSARAGVLESITLSFWEVRSLIPPSAVVNLEHWKALPTPLRWLSDGTRGRPAWASAFSCNAGKQANSGQAKEKRTKRETKREHGNYDGANIITSPSLWFGYGLSVSLPKFHVLEVWWCRELAALLRGRP